MDLSGLGDSGTYNGEPENQVYAARATADVTTAIQYMQQHHAIADYHAIGLCSGAYHSLKSAFSGIAFRSIVAINPLTFSWRPGLTLAYPQHRIAADVMRYKKTAFQFSSWKKLLRGQVDIGELLQVLIRRGWSVTTHAARDAGRRVGIPLKDDLGTELRKLSRQNTKALFVFAAGDPGLDLLHAGGGFVVKQMQRNSLLRIEIIDSADHTFTPRWSRDALINVLTAHIRDHRSSI
jgi:hypothetical protein